MLFQEGTAEVSLLDSAELAGPVADDWWTTFHTAEMADLLLVRSSSEELRQTLDFLVQELRLRPGDRAYDQCCGIGSLSIPLAERGMQIVGADLCDHYIARAQREAKGNCRFVCGDAFQFVPEAPCDGVFNWYSSFGYALTDARNAQMIRRAYESLRPGGLFALEMPNFFSLLRNFQPRMERQGVSAGRDVTLVRESTIDMRRGRLEQVWTWNTAGREPFHHRSALRIYFSYQIAEMFDECGFTDIRFFADVRSKKFTLDDPRFICVGERPTEV